MNASLLRIRAAINAGGGELLVQPDSGDSGVVVAIIDTGDGGARYQPAVSRCAANHGGSWRMCLGNAGRPLLLTWPSRHGPPVLLPAGVDASHPELQGLVIGGKSFVGEDPMRDNVGHGTMVAGILAARNGNGGIVGAAPGKWQLAACL